MSRFALSGLLGAAVLTVIAASIFVSFKLSSSQPPAERAEDKPSACPQHGITHTFIFAGGRVQPGHTDARRCDVLMITNNDNQYRIVAFGPHSGHIPYNGVTDKLLGFHQSLTVVLNKPGTFEFHDHLDDAANGTFTVSR